MIDGYNNYGGYKQVRNARTSIGESNQKMDVKTLYGGKVNKQKRMFNLSKAYKQRWKLNIYEKKDIQTKMWVETLYGGKINK